MYCESAGLQNLLSICDKHCASHSMTFNVKKPVCIIFKSSVNKYCDYANVYLSGNHIDFVQEVKYLGVLLNSSIDLLMSLARHGNSMHKPICYCATFVIVVGKEIHVI